MPPRKVESTMTGPKRSGMEPRPYEYEYKITRFF